MNEWMTSKKAWSPGRSSRSENTCGCGLQRSPETALIASTCSEPISNSSCCAAGHDLVLVARPGAASGRSPRRPRRRCRQAWSSSAISSAVLILRASSMTREPSVDLHARALQRFERRPCRPCRSPTGSPRRPRSRSSATILSASASGTPGLDRHRAAHRGHAGAEVLRRQPRRSTAGGGARPIRSPTGSDPRRGTAAPSARSCRAPTRRCACS